MGGLLGGQLGRGLLGRGLLGWLLNGRGLNGFDRCGVLADFRAFFLLAILLPRVLSGILPRVLPGILPRILRVVRLRVVWLLAFLAALVVTTLVLPAASLRILLCGLVHHAEDAEIMLGVLIKAFRRYPVARTCGIAAELLIFFIKLLGGAAHADIRTAAVEHMVAVERNIAVEMPRAAATAAAAIVIATTAMVAPALAFHIHSSIALIR